MRQPLFWNNCVKHGRVNELKFTLALYFKDGFVQGIKNALAMQAIGLKMLKAKRLNPFAIFGGHQCKDRSGIHKIIAKAREIEARRQEQVA